MIYVGRCHLQQAWVDHPHAARVVLIRRGRLLPLLLLVMWLSLSRRAVDDAGRRQSVLVRRIGSRQMELSGSSTGDDG